MANGRSIVMTMSERRTVETILKLRGQKRSPEQIARMSAAQSARRTAERAALPEGERFLFRHSIDRRLEIRSYRHSPETVAKMRVAQSARRTAEQEIKSVGVL